ncbi:unnamed protein product [Ranitomeya imitator]|uniref:Metallo-beta-lactamase domain-containing protein n=1 Tax=Ranitomeya imitator TaxID=111125 RepID=A0ABN9KSV2_9NEOB|nr:unnamed protein product [Ranitomeya imitator]
MSMLPILFVPFMWLILVGLGLCLSNLLLEALGRRGCTSVPLVRALLSGFGALELLSCSGPHEAADRRLDLVIDTGLGLRSLPEYLSAAGLLPHGTDGGSGRRPLMAVATHVHFDHAGGLHQFEQVAVHRDEAEALIRGDNFETVTWLSDSEVVKPPTPGWSASQYKCRR